MSNNPAAPPEGAQPHWSARLAGSQKLIEQALLALAALAALVPVILAVREGQAAFGPTFFWGASLAAIFFGGALASMSYRPDNVSPGERVRVLLMAVLGCVGLATALTGFIMPFTTEWASVLGGLESWRKEPQSLLSVAAALFGGLTLMFLALLIVRGMERSHQSIRWLVFGFNTVFGTLLLAFVLGLVNLLAFADPVDKAFGRLFSREFDWTHSELYTLDRKTEGFLASLDQEVKAYVILPASDLVARDTLTLLRNARSRQSKVDLELIDPLVPENRKRLLDMKQKYGMGEYGVLVIAGDEKGKHDHEFIPLNKLYERRGSARVFTGEGALLGAMSSLVEGRVVIYFTQGHGELTLDQAGMPPMRRGGNPDGLSILKEKLTGDRRNFEIRPLKKDPAGGKIPDDASTVVIARPTGQFTPEEVKALKDYLARKEEKSEGKVKVAPGRLVVMLDPVVRTGPTGTAIVKTGLEDFLRDHGVKVGDNRILSFADRDPLLVVLGTNPRSPCPVARAFNNPEVFQEFGFVNVRTVEPAEGKGSSRVVPLMLADHQYGIFADTDVARDARAVRDAVAKDRKTLLRTVSQTDLPVAVTVVASPSGMPADADHAGLGGPGKDRPQMIVFGNGSWISDEGMSRQEAAARLNLFSSCLSWLREQGDIGATVRAKESMPYNLKVIDEGKLSRLRWLPLWLLLLGVVALGVGVWVVRRK
jgi:hypothetical protein